MRSVGEDPYGAIREAILVFKGFVLDLASLSWSELFSLHQTGSGPKSHWGKRGRLAGSFDSHAVGVVFSKHAGGLGAKRTFYFYVGDGHPDPEAGELKFRANFEIRLDFYYSNQGSEPLSQLISQLKMLLMGKSESSQGQGYDHGHGLMIMPLEGELEPRYLRVGAFRSAWKYRDWQRPRLERLKGLMKEERITLC